MGSQQSSSELFLTLTEWRPSRLVDLDLRGVGAFSAKVTAVPAHVLARASTATNRAAQIICDTLTVDGEKAFASAEEACSLLTTEDLASLASVVNESLALICPRYGFCHLGELNAKLMAGAREHETITIALDSCSEYAHDRILERPHWYWGQPLCDLLDGHWMVYRAAREVMNGERKKNSASAEAGGTRKNRGRR